MSSIIKSLPSILLLSFQLLFLPQENLSFKNNLLFYLAQDLCIPELALEDEVIKHPGFYLVYNEEHEQADWVAYELTQEKAQAKIAKRTDKFLVDPLIQTGSATNEDYYKSGYDRGHLAPAADMSFSHESMAASFYYSNMSPQAPSFNRGIWAKLEETVRQWVIKNKHVLIVTGPVLNAEALGSIGPNNVTVPSAYYKVLLDISGNDYKGIAFILPNEGSKEALSSFVFTIDEAEEITGINFFPLLPEDLEILAESQADFDAWGKTITPSIIYDE